MLQFRRSFALILLELATQLAPSAGGAMPIDHACSTGICSHDNYQYTAVSSSIAWRFGRVSSPDQTESLVSITKTADTMQSDPDFAGLMIRCGKGGKIDVLLVLVTPFPPKAHPQITLQGNGAPAITLQGSMATGGAAVLLPDSAGALPGGSWQRLKSLSVAVKDDGREIKGLVDLGGLAPAYVNLLGSCG